MGISAEQIYDEFNEINKKVHKVETGKTIISLATLLACFFTKQFYLYPAIVSLYLGFSISYLKNLIKTKKALVDNSNMNIEYDKIIDELTMLLNKLEITNPVEVATAHRYMLSKGYLSKDKNYFYSHSSHNLFGHNEFDVLAGNGVCRHIVPHLNSVYDNMEIENLDIYTRIIGKIPVTDEFKSAPLIDDLTSLMLTEENPILKIIEEVMNNVEKQSETNFEVTPEFIKESFENATAANPKIFTLIDTIQQHNQIDAMQRTNKKANHVISGAIKDGIGYFLDPTNMFSLRPIDKKTIGLSEGSPYEECSMLIKPSYYSNRFNMKKISEIMACDFLDYSTYKNLFDITLDRCKSNEDMLESFYNKNNDRYSFISDELNKVKINVKK